MGRPIKKRDFKPQPLEGHTDIPGQLDGALSPLGLANPAEIIGADDVPPPPPRIPRASGTRGRGDEEKQASTLRTQKRYTPAMDRLGNGLALAGFTIAEMAAQWGVPDATVRGWRDRYPSFEHALLSGWNGASIAVVRALYRRAVGYEYTRRKSVIKHTDKGTEVSEEVTTEHLAPDVAAITKWLSYRMGDKWGRAAELEAAKEAEKDNPLAGGALTLQLQVVRNDDTNYLEGANHGEPV